MRNNKNLMLGLFGLSFVGLLTCFGYLLTRPSDKEVLAATAAVDLQALNIAFSEHVKRNTDDLSEFEKAVNKPPIYHGTQKVSVAMKDDGGVVGFVDKNANGTYTANEPKMFEVQVEAAKKRIVSHDSRRRYYHSPTGPLMGFLLMDSMMRRQHRRGMMYSAPVRGNWVKSGYHQGIRRDPRGANSRWQSRQQRAARAGTRSSSSSRSSSSRSSGSGYRSSGTRSVRSGSIGGRSSGGGFGSGK